MNHVITGVSYIPVKTGDALMCLEESMRVALSSGKLKISAGAGSNIGIFLGTTFSNFSIRKNNFDKLNKLGIRAVNPADFPKLLISYLGGCLSIKVGTKGAMSVLSSGSSSGLDALGQALFFLKRDKKNIAAIIELDETWEGESLPEIKASTCFICENIAVGSRRKIYADILGIQNYFEEENEASGISECIKKVSEPFLSKKDKFQFLSSAALNSNKYLLEEKALRGIFPDENNKLIPAKAATNSGLKALYDVFKSKKFTCLNKEKMPVSLFLSAGRDSNSTCLAMKLSGLVK